MKSLRRLSTALGLCVSCAVLLPEGRAQTGVVLGAADVFSTAKGECGRVNGRWVSGRMSGGRFTPLGAIIKKTKTALRSAKGARAASLKAKLAKLTAQKRSRDAACRTAAAAMAPTPEPTVGSASVPAATPVPGATSTPADPFVETRDGVRYRFIEAYLEARSLQVIAWFELTDLSGSRSIDLSSIYLDDTGASLSTSECIAPDGQRFESTACRFTLPLQTPLVVGFAFNSLPNLTGTGTLTVTRAYNSSLQFRTQLTPTPSKFAELYTLSTNEVAARLVSVNHDPSTSEATVKIGYTAKQAPISQYGGLWWHFLTSRLTLPTGVTVRPIAFIDPFGRRLSSVSSSSYGLPLNEEIVVSYVYPNIAGVQSVFPTLDVPYFGTWRQIPVPFSR